MAEERCPECNKLTDIGLVEMRKRFMKHSIFGVDFEKPVSVSIEEIRSMLSTARGRLTELGYQMPQLETRLKDAEGLLTCGLIALSDVVKEARQFEHYAEERKKIQVESKDG